MTRIFIENNELDISKGLSNEITYSIDDITKIDSKTTSFSKTIVLPGTANNNRLLGNIFDFNNANLTNSATANVLYNFDASRSAVARIEVDGYEAERVRTVPLINFGEAEPVPFTLFQSGEAATSRREAAPVPSSRPRRRPLHSSLI